MRSSAVLSVSMLILTACSGLHTTPIPFTQPSQPTDTPRSATSAPTVPASTTRASPTAGGTGNAQGFPDPNAFQWAPVVSGLALPTDIQFPDDGSGRMFVLEQAGSIQLVKDGQLSGAPFLDIRDKVGSAGNEQGLLGMAFHPDFKHNPFFYINYTDTDGNTVIARYTASGDQAEAVSEKVLLRVNQPFANHKGGVVVFGPDGDLYLGLGDGGSQGDPLGNGQNTQVLLGKLLRIDVLHGDPYSIPADNPFAQSGGRPEIWAYGLRNPWRVSFDRLTRDLYIADVGQDLWEEVDFIPSGSPGGTNFGWNYFEGNHPYSGNPPANLQLTFPVTEYSHAEGGCSIIGGYVYRGSLPEWQGIYLYADYCSGLVWGLMRSSTAGSQTGWVSELLFQTGENITTFGQDQSGEIYFAGRAGTIYKLQKRQ